ncbi:MAG: OmpA family protein [Proteobacteria bacterium]|nr:OmpA family protein [Pseudomonadota bacterium]MBU1418026.1 OmpA family protein [Pseudomonadota bacterium]MBU1455923.1 OmpA family protein [Pseudomonadota bacterium]
MYPAFHMNQQPEPSEHSSPLPKNAAIAPVLPAADLLIGKRLVSPAPENRFYENSFVIEDSFYRSRLPKGTHWSIAWSDLMMTMFILFLSLFVYQAAHEDFLVSHTPEVVGGSTTEALDIEKDGDLIVPIIPLRNKAPLVTAGTIKKLEKVTIDAIDVDDVFQENADLVRQSTAPGAVQETVEPEAEQAPDLTVTEDSAPSVSLPILSSAEDILQPAPLLPVEEKAPPGEEKSDRFSGIYDKSVLSLNTNKLNDFASVDLIPDTTMRIILTGDLLFATGQADLSTEARDSLKKIATIIKNTPYMINVIGHTDNLPMHSALFATNWELSVVRASRVARFLIEEMGMQPDQFIVSGYGANRPRQPNTNVVNRAANRRVEIIISKRMPPAVQATPKNLY